MKTKAKKTKSPKETFIKWISVHDRLPKNNQMVIVLTEYDGVATTQFSPERGWNFSVGSIKFWSEYNLPK